MSSRVISNGIIALASQPYRVYFQETTEKLNKSISNIVLPGYSKLGIFILVFLMWFGQAITMVKED